MKKLKALYVRQAWIIGVLLAVLMLVGTFYDLKISKFMYPGHENTFGQFFAAFGKLPAFMGLAAAGVLLYGVRGKLRRGLIQWAALAASAVLVVGGIVVGAKEMADDITVMPMWAALLTSAFACGVFSLGLAMLSRGCPAKTVIRFVCATVFAIVAAIVVVKLLKSVWGRPRMLLLSAAGNDSLFVPWYRPGLGLKKRLIEEGVAKEMFESFPSGHASCAACSLLLVLLPTLGKAARRRERLCLLVGAAWTLIVCFSRVMMGAHFLTDVTAAVAITLICAIIGIKLFYFSGAFFRRFWGLIAEPQKNMDGQER